MGWRSSRSAVRRRGTPWLAVSASPATLLPLLLPVVLLAAAPAAVFLESYSEGSRSMESRSTVERMQSTPMKARTDTMPMQIKMTLMELP